MNLLQKKSTGAVVGVRWLCARVAASLLLLSACNTMVIAQADPFDAEKFMAAIEVQGQEYLAIQLNGINYHVYDEGDSDQPGSSDLKKLICRYPPLRFRHRQH